MVSYIIVFRCILIGFIIFFNNYLQAQEQQVVQIRALGEQGLSLREGWKFLPGSLDDRHVIDPDFDDVHLPTVNSQLWLDSLKQKKYAKGGWFRLRFKLGKILQNKRLALKIDQRGASEIYLDGRLIHQYGLVSTNPSEEIKYSGRWLPLPIMLDNSRDVHVLVIKYSNSNAQSLYKYFGRYARTAGFKLVLGLANQMIMTHDVHIKTQIMWNTGLFAVLFTIGVLHFVIYFFNHKKRAELFYALFSLSMGTQFLFDTLLLKEQNPEVIIIYNIINLVISRLQVVFLLRFACQLFECSISKFFKYYYGLCFLAIIIFFINYPIINYLEIGYFFFFMLATFRVIQKAILHKKRGAILTGTGIMITYVFMFIISERAFQFINLWGNLPDNLIMILNSIGILSTTMAVSIYLARNIAQTNMELENQLENVKELSLKTTQQALHNKEILKNQNAKLEELVKIRTSEVQEKNIELSQQNEEIAMQRDSIEQSKFRLKQAYTKITDSVRYAQRIQRAVLGSKNEIVKQFDRAFIFFRPKDIVSGDFYWYQEVPLSDPEHDNSSITQNGKRKILVVGDCTGHGVPGAFMTVMGANFLDEIVNSLKITEANSILEELDRKITFTMHRYRFENPKTAIRDGMDITILVIDEGYSKVHFSGAKNPLYLVRNGEIEQYATSRHAIGDGVTKLREKKFQKQWIDIQPNDTIYMATDGFQDQFGGNNDKKFLKKHFRDLLLNISALPISKQKLALRDELQAWQRHHKQTDDILVVGIQL